MDKYTTKDFFIKYGIFTGVLVVILGLIIYINIYSRKSWNTNLKNSIESVLEQSEPGAWEVGELVELTNPISVNAICFNAVKNGSDEYKVIMVRTISFYGPVPAVFVCDSENNVSFVGYSYLNGRIHEQLVNNKSDKRLEYWQDKITDILK